ncbi:MAG: 50S ribosomal protein L29 [Xanthomonadaceae bacterium]|jgi:large subunit ribosomal protein L29|nr:50S ribosomal protein L29 [Xanthomonadaceae bacterium]MCW8875009.1 50S ribosomal protein L29 [Gammaproteobacteria bacterium]MCW9059909.1 50S ribosomal protein L29 [Gammaproteobacteria bacterium]
MKANTMRDKNVADLQQELEGLLREQFNLRMQKGTGQLSRPDQVKKVRRNIARVKTIMSEKTRAGDAS